MVTDSVSRDSAETAATANDAKNSGSPVIFFDGVCGLCNHFVNFILAHDLKGLFLLAPLQGMTAGERLDIPVGESLNSVVLWDGDSIYRKSAAVVRILWELGGFWRILGGLLWLIPRPFRDAGYALVAMLRYRLFGKKEVCRMPTPEERERFLD